MRTHTKWVILSALVLLALMTSAVAQDWPQWLGPQRDGKPSQFNAPEQWPPALIQQWQVPVGAGDASPVLVGDRLYVYARQNDQEVTVCLNLADGAVVWQDTTPAPVVTGPASSHSGPRSSPAVAEGRIVTIGVTGMVSCLEAATGVLQWRKTPYPDAYPQFYTASSPLIIDGLVLAHLGAESRGGMVALDLITGNERWKWTAEGPQYASPTLMEFGDVKALVTLSAKSFIGVNVVDGSLLWQVPFIPEGRAYNAATPVISGDTVIISGAGRGTQAYCLVAEGGVLTPTPLWTNTEQAVQYCTPVLKEGLLFGLSSGGKLFCLHADTGVTAWVDETLRSRGFGPLVDAGTALLALPDNGELVAFQPTAEAYVELGKYKVAEGGTYATPLLSGKAIITKDQTAVTAWSLP